MAPKKTGIDAKAMVEALVNHNPPPKLVDKARPLVFDPKYDTRESKRAWHAFKELIPHAEEAWPELVRHLDDERYSATFLSPSDAVHVATVGEMCHMIIERNLEVAYFRHFNLGSMDVAVALERPEMVRGTKELKAWCEARSSKKLYELQIEACQWAIKELNKNQEIRGVTPAMRRAWVAAVQSQTSSLLKSQEAVPFKGFGDDIESYGPPR
jgi:hypothetical protein